ncbi:MAG: hypothetical protein CME65_03595 [Halobacteriovoraceae bacterium]|nr:hypothetical protein [Halobacteriovoraceae bacterium]|tara:strand:- start:1669 stop:2541 length:873 start_codon:yes stop_codon:yes gene_type:complete
MEGVLNALINYVDKYTEEIFFLEIGVFVIVATLLVSLYIYNRKKYHNLKHQIPASVVKNYLDSIIQNSTALKSSLFRGGGIDVDPSGIPSVFPLDQLAGSGQATAGSAGGDEALRAEVSRLQAQLTEKNNVLQDIEKKNIELSGNVKAKQERIEELEALLNDGGGDTAELSSKLGELTSERDKLKEELEQFNVIADDLADLKRFKQENEQLKKALAEGGGSVPEPEQAPEVAEPEQAPEVAEPAAEAPVEEPAQKVEEPMAAAPPEEEEASSGDEKSPEDLLSEFEKMLG